MEDPIDIDELDPCCQRELESRKKNKEVSARLRQHDRTYARIDAQKSVLKDVKKSNSCNCCVQSIDYSSLSRIKLNLKKSEEATDNYQFSKHEESDENLEDSYEDSDEEFLNDLDDYENPELLEKLQSVTACKDIGLGVHREDSIDHLSTYIRTLPYVLVHLYYDTTIDAMIDITLERLASKYLGTLTRRLYTLTPNIHTFINTWILNASYSNNISHSSSVLQAFQRYEIPSCLLLFRHHQLVYIEDDLSKYCTSSLSSTITSNQSSIYSYDDVYENDLLHMLDRHHLLSYVLSTEDVSQYYRKLSQINVNANSRNTGVNENEEERDEDVSSYCDDPQCTRRFPHEHVTTKKGMIGVTHLLQNKTESNIFHDNYFTKL